MSIQSTGLSRRRSVTVLRKREVCEALKVSSVDTRQVGGQAGLLPAADVPGTPTLNISASGPCATSKTSWRSAAAPAA